jgi:hypothetical protein
MEMRNIGIGACIGSIIACGLAIRFLPGVVAPACMVMGMAIVSLVAFLTLEK